MINHNCKNHAEVNNVYNNQTLFVELPTRRIAKKKNAVKHTLRKSHVVRHCIQEHNAHLLMLRIFKGKNHLVMEKTCGTFVDDDPISAYNTNSVVAPPG